MASILLLLFSLLLTLSSADTTTTTVAPAPPSFTSVSFLPPPPPLPTHIHDQDSPQQLQFNAIFDSIVGANFSNWAVLLAHTDPFHVPSLSHHLAGKFTINGAPITRLDLFHSAVISVHGIDGVLGHNLFRKMPLRWKSLRRR